MSRRVPLARRALFQDRRCAALAAGGVAAALLLVLLLQGIFDGAMRQVIRTQPGKAPRRRNAHHLTPASGDPDGFDGALQQAVEWLASASGRVRPPG